MERPYERAQNEAAALEGLPHKAAMPVEYATPNYKKDCFSCRAVGTVIPLGCSAYLASILKDIPRRNVAHRGMVIVFAAGFAAMGCVRAFI
jgi:hypothetical protein